ncbi:hypothetical protein L345_16379, partial [Ophiophagus hannah]
MKEGERERRKENYKLHFCEHAPCPPFLGPPTPSCRLCLSATKVPEVACQHDFYQPPAPPAAKSGGGGGVGVRISSRATREIRGERGSGAVRERQRQSLGPRLLAKPHPRSEDKRQGAEMNRCGRQRFIFRPAGLASLQIKLFCRDCWHS